jgi:hypothetical protein
MSPAQTACHEADLAGCNKTCSSSRETRRSPWDCLVNARIQLPCGGGKTATAIATTTRCAAIGERASSWHRCGHVIAGTVVFVAGSGGQVLNRRQLGTWSATFISTEAQWRQLDSASGQHANATVGRLQLRPVRRSAGGAEESLRSLSGVAMRRRAPNGRPQASTPARCGGAPSRVRGDRLRVSRSRTAVACARLSTLVGRPWRRAAHVTHGRGPASAYRASPGTRL